MMPADPIFGLRFQSNDEVLPGNADLKAFLESRKKATGQERHGDDLARYAGLLKGVEAFQSRQLSDANAFGEKLLYGVLTASQFVKPALKTAVEQSKFHLHSYQSLDLKKPADFIRVAEEEMKDLNPNKKKADADKMLRLRNMVEERKKALAVLMRRRSSLAEEMGHLARYVRDNLSRIERLCEASIAVLVELQISRKKEEQLVEDIKAEFKERLRGSLHEGSIKKQDLENVKSDVAQLAKEIADLLRGDVFALTGLYETIHGHVKKSAQELSDLLEGLSGVKKDGLEEEGAVLQKIEQSLVSLVSDCRFELKLADVRTSTAHENILLEKRKEMSDYLLDALKKVPA